jgi:hypothetical protein
MDFEKNYLKIDNEDDIFNLDEENKQQQGQETFCAEERFLVGEENVSAKEENEIIDSKPKNNNEIKEKVILIVHIYQVRFLVLSLQLFHQYY